VGANVHDITATCRFGRIEPAMVESPKTGPVPKAVFAVYSEDCTIVMAPSPKDRQVRSSEVRTAPRD
jgi:hypothetical protein